MTSCVRCGAHHPGEAQYCGRCGVRLASGGNTDSDPPVRKYAAVLFVDLVGSTGVAERVDPEVLGGILSRYFEVVSEAVWRHGGAVEKYIGDAVMAVFGAPASHGDDAHRAVRAAVDALAAVARLSTAVESELGVRLEARAGVNGGLVYVARRADGQLSVTGDAVHVAQRLESVAPPGGVLIGASVGATVGDAWELESLGAVHHRGRARASEAYLVGAALEVDPRRGAIIGRDRELESLYRLREQCWRRRRSSAVTVVGEAGVGKSRLIAELATQAPVVTVTCRPDRTSTFGLLDDLVDQLAPDWQERVRAARPTTWRSAVTRLRPGPDATTSVEDVVEAVRTVIGVLAETDPVLMVWDDAHAATEHQLDLIARIIEAVHDDAVLTVVATRPRLFSQHPRWGGGRRSRVIDLEPLSEESIAALVRSEPTATAGAVEVTDEVVRRAQGNPALALALARWPTQADLPPTAQMLFAALLEQLEPSSRSSCEAAAQLDEGFTAAEIAAAVGSTEVEAQVALARLVTHDLLVPCRGSVDGVRRFAFASRLLQEAVREMVPSSRRREIHRRVAQHLEEVGASLERVLHHYDCAGRTTSGPVPGPDAEGPAGHAASDLRDRWIRELAAVGDPRLIEEIAAQAETLADGDSRILTLLFQVLIAPSSAAARDCLAAVMQRCAATPWWPGVRAAVETLLELRRGTVSAVELLPRAELHETYAGDPDQPIGGRLVHLLLLGQVFAGTSCFDSCADVAAAGIRLAREVDDLATERLFRGLEVQMAFVAPDDLAETARLAERHLAAVAGSARETAKTQAILTATYAYLGAFEAAARAWSQVDTPAAALDAEELVVARQYNALRLEVADSPAAAAAEWRAAASGTTNAPLARAFRASASECYLRAGRLDLARAMREISDGADLDHRFALLEAIEAAVLGDVVAMADRLDRLDHVDGVRAATLDATMATVGRAMAHAAAGDEATAARLVQDATASMHAVGAVALPPVAEAAVASSRRLGSSLDASG